MKNAIGNVMKSALRNATASAAKNLSVLEAACAVTVAAVVLGCNGDLTLPSATEDGNLMFPSRGDFDSVADAMELHCGTLDCHGQVGRNMRLYGQYGLRLDPKDDPLNEPTSDAEYDASYESIVGLEPETMSLVVQHLAPPEALTMIRKPAGLEEHKGGQLFVQGDPLDRCMVGWLTGAFDADACNTVVQAPRPEPEGGP
jgi:hypothetical protein